MFPVECDLGGFQHVSRIEAKASGAIAIHLNSHFRHANLLFELQIPDSPNPGQNPFYLRSFV